MFFRWLPPAFGSWPAAALVYFVPSTMLPAMSLHEDPPKNVSLVPLVYMLAVSMKSPPAGGNAS